MDVLLTLLGLSIAGFGVTGLYLGFGRAGLFPPRFTPARMVAGLGLTWIVTLSMLAFVRVVEGRSLASIGIRFSEQWSVFWLSGDLIGGVVFAFFVVGVVGAVPTGVLQYFGYLGIDDSYVFLLAQSPLVKVIFGVTAGITEEILYRGYLIERTIELTGSPALAGVLSVGAFTLAHLPGRTVQSTVVRHLGLAVGFVVAYLLLRNVVILATVHAIINLVTLLPNGPDDVLEKGDLSGLDDRLVPLIEDD